MTRRWPYVALAALVVVLGVLAVWRPGGSPPASAPDERTAPLSLPLPDAFGPWTRLDDPPTAKVERALRESVTQGGAAVEVAVALYAGEDVDHARITVFLPRPGSTTARDLAADPATQLDSFLRGSGVTAAQVEDAGESGVTLECGTAEGDYPAACGWSDGVGLALVAYDRAGLDRDAAAALTRDLRDDLAGA